MPVMLLILLGIADFGRLFASAVAVEAAGREAADFGAFDASYWTPANVATTVAEMERRACVAPPAATSRATDHGPGSNATCTNPVVLVHARTRCGVDRLRELGGHGGRR